MAISAFRVFIRIIENTSLTGTGCFDSPYSYGSFCKWCAWSGLWNNWRPLCAIILYLLFASPIDRKMFLEALIFGSIIGAFPHIICYAGDTVLIAIKEF